jgi:threonine dehydrogenase-like Zn-dependent dehydrogenase
VNLLTAKAMGAAQVIVTDINESRLQVARQLGADHVYTVGTQV